MVGDNIKTFRERRGYTQAQLADRIHVSSKTVSSWEVNRTEPSMGMIERMSAALGCSKIELIGDVSVLSPAELDLINKYRSLDHDSRAVIIDVVNGLFSRQKKGSATASA